ncbi:pyridoxamine 5'-phosphate oxidase [Hymenobacter psychrotolerans]|uniref:Pyridoxine/pyridoxamine 5'-phosphate oxidase n=1 Tax=Hymenobacter psychrotolerans DSM 18569 TaxID=1121959 RepID=A0A1M7G8Z7_9BACT|nr:pyridoxamine 5'-phosphate oxidase [Hymenobacter psychrotolerans]SHM12407.1 Pyridoxamine 5'-phosphate oxidase [Hymenobacter psychrotolerans DSM 18569]
MLTASGALLCFILPQHLLMIDPHLADLRKTYAQRTLSEADVLPAAVLQFRRWLEEALQAQLDEPTAMTLATVSESGQPSARVVLLKGLPDDAGLLFYTNYESRKGQELAARPLAAATFFWPGLERQVRVEGRVEKAPASLSDEYFQSRPRASQVGAWASPQSQKIESRQQLEQQETAVLNRFGDQDPLPRPEHWGGYILRPHRIEFWQGRPSRLHDRIVYELEGDTWRLSRLAP